MKLKKSKKEIKIMIPVIGMLCSLGSFAVGFSMWTVTGGTSGGSVGSFESDDTNYDDNPVTVFTVPSGGKPSFTSLSGYGFLVNNEYVNSITLTWTFSFDAKTALPLIESLSSNRVWFNFTLAIDNIPARIGDFSVGGMTLTPNNTTTGGTVTVYKQIVNTGTAINEQWNISGVNTTLSNVTYTLSVPLTYTGTRANFPDLKTNKLTLTFEAGEFKNA